MPRLFTGIEIPEHLKDELGALEAPLPGAKWVPVDDLHLTLRFAGDVDNRTADELAQFLAEIRAEPFELQFSELGSFGGRDPKVVFAGFKPCPALLRLQRAHEAAARAAGLPPEPRPFKPHVTLARLRYARAEALARYLGHRGGFRSAPFMVESFALFSAKPGGGGPYVLEAEYPLGVHFGSAWVEGEDGESDR